MLRFRFWVAILTVLGVIVVTVLRAQDSDEEKKQQFLKTRHAASDSDETPTPKPKKKTAKKKSAAKKDDEDSSPAPKDKKSPTPKPKSKKSKRSASGSKSRKKKKIPEPEETPKPRKAESSAATPVPVERPTAPPPRAMPAASADDRAQVLVEKSGLDGEQGLVPPPSPPPRRFLFWPLSSRSSEGSYRYLTRSIIDEIRRAPVQRRRWQFIVVHNSGTRQGNARVFDYYHKHVRRMQNGLAYHFVIGNGTSTGNGQIEIGNRWRRQINGGHVHSDYLNNISLGICLVGDFNRDQPTKAQLECCEELIRYLRQRCGKVDNHDILVRPHREMNPPRWATDCPGDAFPYSWFRRFR